MLAVGGLEIQCRLQQIAALSVMELTQGQEGVCRLASDEEEAWREEGRDEYN